MKQRGRNSHLTAEQIERVRDVDRRWREVRREKAGVQAELGISSGKFGMIGSGLLGKKPRTA